jgi:hypothetical protein
MSLKALRAEIERAAEEIRGRFDDSLRLVVVGVIDGRIGAGPLPCTGFACSYFIAGTARKLFFPGDQSQAERVARALFDHAYQFETTSGCRPAAVCVQQTEAPVDVITIEQPADGQDLAEHVSRIYNQLRAAP